jgi:dTMP kinase
MKSRGQLLIVDGIDGAGKSENIASIQRLLECEGLDVVVTREPGGTELAESLRALILNQPMDSLTEALLVFAARRDHVKNVIEPALARGAWVLSDRFIDSTWAYQGAGRGFDLQVLGELERWVLEGLRPDLTLWYDASPVTAARRRSGVRAADRFEAEEIAFFERVQAGYRMRMEADSHRYRRIDANQSREAVWEAVQKAIRMFVSANIDK